jgi:hypothetical protein
MQMWFTGEYRDVLENARLVYTQSLSDEDGNVSAPSDLDMAAGRQMTTEVRVEIAVPMSESISKIGLSGIHHSSWSDRRACGLPDGAPMSGGPASGCNVARAIAPGWALERPTSRAVRHILW